MARDHDGRYKRNAKARKQQEKDEASKEDGRGMQG